MAPARAAAVSICITTGACSLLAPQPKNLLTYSMAPWLVDLLALLASGFRFPYSYWETLGFPCSCCLTLGLSHLPCLPLTIVCIPFSTRTLRRQPNMRMKLVAVTYVHIYFSDSSVNHSCVTAFFPTLGIIWMVTPLD